jgi:hypothetical protein
MASMPSGATQPTSQQSLKPEIPSAADRSGTVHTGSTLFELPCIDNRERALPIRQGDLTRLLLAQPGLTEIDRSRLEAFGKILGAVFHSEFYEKLRELKELYAPLDPDSDYVSLGRHSRALSDDSDEVFLEPFATALERANYRELDIDVIKEAVSAPNETGITYVPDFSLFEHLSVWVRGYTQIARVRRTVLTRFRSETVHLAAYQRLIVALKFKPGIDLGPLVRSDVLYLRMFKDVPHVDMEMHLPEQGTRPIMRWIDKAQFFSPLVIGIPTAVLKLAMAAIFSPMLLGGVAVGLIAAPVNSLFSHQRAKQRHLMGMIHRLYYLTLANNASVLTRLIDSAEDEEYKEAMLAYFFLWQASGEVPPLTVPVLDDRIEAFLEQSTHVSINFEVADALKKLFRLGLVHRDAEGGLHALPIDEALRTLDRVWDNEFGYAEA